MGEQKEDILFTTMYFVKQILVDCEFTIKTPPSGEENVILVTKHSTRKRLLINPFDFYSYKLDVCSDFPQRIHFPSWDYEYDSKLTDCNYLDLALKIGELLS